MEHTIVICGKGQVSLFLAVNVLLAEQDSVTTQLLDSSHHPQSSDNILDTDKHDEHTPAKPEQLYNITVNENVYIATCNYTPVIYYIPGTGTISVSRVAKFT